MNELVPSFLTKSPKLKLVLRNAISTTISLDLMVMQTLATLQVAARFELMCIHVCVSMQACVRRGVTR